MTKVFTNKIMTRRQLLATSTATLALMSCSVGDSSKPNTETLSLPTSNTNSKPNVIFIMADDLGYADLSCYGRREYVTTNLDNLAKEGVRFTHSYANSSVCSATRAALMTGQYQHRLRVGLEEPVGFGNIGLSPKLSTLPSQFQAAGYDTSLIGKWHLGPLPDYGPLKSGYDHFWGIRGGGVDYFNHSAGGEHDLWDGETEIEQAGYLTELLGKKAVEVLENKAHSDKLFFISLHFTAPHWPWESPTDQQESDRLAKSTDPWAVIHYDGGSLDTYSKMVKALMTKLGMCSTL